MPKLINLVDLRYVHFIYVHSTKKKNYKEIHSLSAYIRKEKDSKLINKGEKVGSFKKKAEE